MVVRGICLDRFLGAGMATSKMPFSDVRSRVNWRSVHGLSPSDICSRVGILRSVFRYL